MARRICRHVKLARGLGGRVRWHVDYLLTNPMVEVKGVLVVEGVLIEHEVAMLMYSAGVGKAAAPRFGSSDCKCPTHLFKANVNEVLGLLSKRYSIKLYRFAEDNPQ